MSVDDPLIFADKFRVPSSRLKNWDYSTPGFYYVTICTLNHNSFFGKIENRKMNPSKSGSTIDDCWRKIPQQFNGIQLDAFVIMPNHLHGVIHITDKFCRDAINRVSTITPGQKIGGFSGRKNPMVNKNLSTVIRWFKGKSTRQIKLTGKFFAWQSRFYDHLIKNQTEYYKIKQYIINNPTNWFKDPYHG